MKLTILASIGRKSGGRCAGRSARAARAGVAAVMLAAAGAVMLGQPAPAAAQCGRYWVDGPGMFSHPPEAQATYVESLGTFEGKLVIGGWFSSTPPNSHSIAAWDGLSMSALGTFNYSVDCFKSYDVQFLTHVLIAGGGFTLADGASANGIAIRTDSAQTGGPPGWQAMGAGFDGTVLAIERFNNITYAGGLFEHSGGTTTEFIAQWNGSSWQPVGGGLNGGCYVLRAFNGSLYAGGTFTTAGGASAAGLARWDGAAWHPAIGNIASQVFAIEPFGSGLAVGGKLTGLSGSPKAALYNESTGYSALGSGASDGEVDSFAVVANQLYAAGDFTHIGGVAAGGIAVWNGSAWSDLGMTLAPNYSVFDRILAYHGEIVSVDPPASQPYPPYFIPRYLASGVPWLVSGSGPIDQRACGRATFTVQPAWGYDNYFAWQMLDATGAWVTISNAAVPGGGRASVDDPASQAVQFDVRGVTGLRTIQIRCVVYNDCGSTTSNTAAYTVCAADYDCSGTLTVQDIFAFLNAWFAGVPTADFDGVNGLQVADIFAFLNAWFAGC